MAKYQYSSTAIKELVGNDYSRKRKTQTHNKKKTAPVKIKHPFIWQEALLYIFCIVFITLTLYSQITIMSNKTLLTEEKLFVQKELLTLQESNETFEGILNQKVNLEEIREKAISELGMHLPEEGQVYYYEGVMYDYVRKVSPED